MDPSPAPAGRTAAPRLAQARPSTSRHRRQFSLLVVRGDGVRVVRVNFARAFAAGLATAAVAAVAAVGVLASDYLHLRRVTREAVTYAEQIRLQRATIAGINQRLADLGKEMASWRELHGRIWEPFGPEMQPGARDRGIGGGRPPADFKQGDELNQLADLVTEQGDNLRALDRVMGRAGKVLAALPSRWPVRGGVNSEYGRRRSPWTEEPEFHSGLDIRAGHGTAVRAPSAGTVIHAGAAAEYGTTVILDHGQDIRTLYGHLAKVAVQPGQRVERGTLLAYTGNTGRSTGPHLHYEIHVKGRPVNPRAYLWD
ncbi:MAG TPA: M23 family metallopeptidase [Methylomirabilota bacterium]|nr:M23 family metallopeptidase [Methylomirabilota bacterium]